MQQALNHENGAVQAEPAAENWQHSLLEYMTQELAAERSMRMEAEAKLDQQQHKVLFADTVTAGSDSILVRELAGLLKQNGLDIGQNRLFEWLRENGYVYKKQSSYNLPTQKSLQQKLLEVHIRPRIDKNGNVVTEKTTMVTARGQEYFFKRLIAEKETVNARVPKVRELRQKDPAAETA